MNIPVEYDDECEQKNTNLLLLPKTIKQQFMLYIDPYIEARYAGIQNLDHT